MRTGIQSRWCPIRCEHVTLFSTTSDPRSEPGLASNLGHFRTLCINCLSSESEDKMLIWHPGSGAGEEGRKGRFVSKEGSAMEMKGTLFLMGKDKLGQGNIFPKFCSLCTLYPSFSHARMAKTFAYLPSAGHIHHQYLGRGSCLLLRDPVNYRAAHILMTLPSCALSTLDQQVAKPETTGQSFCDFTG